MFQNPHLKSQFFVIYQWDIAHKPPKFDGLCIITRAEILRNVTFLHFCKTPVVKGVFLFIELVLSPGGVSASQTPPKGSN